MLAAAAGAALAVVLPNHLNWASESPYFDSAAGMLDYETGSTPFRSSAAVSFG